MREMPKLKQEIISYVFKEAVKLECDEWHHFKGEFIFEGVTYNFDTDARWDNQMFTYKNLHIERKQVVIDVDEMNRLGLLN